MPTFGASDIPPYETVEGKEVNVEAPMILLNSQLQASIPLLNMKHRLVVVIVWAGLTLHLLKAVDPLAFRLDLPHTTPFAFSCVDNSACFPNKNADVVYHFLYPFKIYG
jgi:hypothetical protein